EGLGEIFIRMALRIPESQMLDIILAGWVWPVIGRITDRRWTEQLLPAPTPLQLIGVLYDMPGFVPEDAHAFLRGSALDFRHHLSLQPHQAGMGEIERDGYARRGLRAEPFVRDPGVRPDAQSALIEFLMEIVETSLEPGSRDGNPEVLEAQLEQPLIRP